MYQKITKILEKLATQVQVEAETRLQAVDKALRETSTSLAGINPHLDQLRNGLRKVDKAVEEALGKRKKVAPPRPAALGIILLTLTGRQDLDLTFQKGLEDARSLQQLLTGLLSLVQDTDARIMRSQEFTMHFIAEKLEEEIASLMQPLGAAASASTAIQQHMVRSRLKARRCHYSLRIEHMASRNGRHIT